MEAKHIKKAFLKCGIKPGDSLFIHGDAGAVAQIKVKSRNKINLKVSRFVLFPLQVLWDNYDIFLLKEPST